MKKIVLIGAGSHCKVIIDIINSMNEFNIVGITDGKVKVGDKIKGVPILGNDDILGQLREQGVEYAFVCIGALNDISIRNKIFNNLQQLGYKFPKLIHKRAIVCDSAVVGEGTCIMPGVIINSDAKIGSNCILNTGSVIEHDCVIGNNVHISPRACICGTVTIGNNSHIGANSTIIQMINIGSGVIVGAGSVVTKSFGDGYKIIGVPGKGILK